MACNIFTKNDEEFTHTQDVYFVILPKVKMRIIFKRDMKFHLMRTIDSFNLRENVIFVKTESTN